MLEGPLSQKLHQEHQNPLYGKGYTLKGSDSFSIEHPTGELQVIISRYHAEDRSGDKPAFNTTVKFVPKGRIWGVRKLLQLQYLEVQYRCKLPDPRPKFKIISIQPSDSPIFRAIENGDVHMVRSLLVSRQASIYDQDQCGWTLLHVSNRSGENTSVLTPFFQCAVQCGHFGPIELLLHEGLDPEAQDM